MGYTKYLPRVVEIYHLTSTRRGKSPYLQQKKRKNSLEERINLRTRFTFDAATPQNLREPAYSSVWTNNRKALQENLPHFLRTRDKNSNQKESST